LTKPVAQGGLALGRITSSLVIACLVVVLVAITHRFSSPEPVSLREKGN